MRRIARIMSLMLALSAPLFAADEEKPASEKANLKLPDKPDASKMPHMTVDVKAKQIRIECEALNPQLALEFFCCATGTNEHEAVLRSSVKASHLHLGMLMLGLEPGEPVHYSKAADKWLAPHGPPVHIFCEFTDKDNKAVRVPAYRMMRNVKTKKEMPPITWIFAGSRVMEDGKYAADTTGYLVSVVNFDLTVIDIPDLASNSNESLEWEFNPDVVPVKTTKVMMIIEPAADKKDDKPKGDKADNIKAAADKAGSEKVNANLNIDKGAADKSDTTKPVSEVQLDEEKVKALRSRWEKAIVPHNAALRQAAQAHYEVMNSLRKEQNRLIDEADRIQRVIDQLQKEYQDMTTPRPEDNAPANN